MPFEKNNPKTVEAGRKGGTTGKKFLQTMSPERLKKFTSEAGKKSAEARKKAKELKRIEVKAHKIEHEIMRSYLI
jgi:hypothetical protein